VDAAVLPRPHPHSHSSSAGTGSFPTTSCGQSNHVTAYTSITKMKILGYEQYNSGTIRGDTVVYGKAEFEFFDHTGKRTLAMAQCVVRQVAQMLAPDCIPLFLAMASKSTCPHSWLILASGSSPSAAKAKARAKPPLDCRARATLCPVRRVFGSCLGRRWPGVRERLPVPTPSVLHGVCTRS